MLDGKPAPQGNPSKALRDQVRKAFRANQHLTDEDKIAECKQEYVVYPVHPRSTAHHSAINGLANCMFHESQRMAKVCALLNLDVFHHTPQDLSGKRLPKAK